MNRFLVITNKEKDKDLLITKKIASYIEKNGRTAVLTSVSPVQEDNTPIPIDDNFDCAIVLGGDGTIIQSANDLMTKGIPILGINLGTLGFLAEIETNHVEEALDRLFIDDYHVENRVMIRGEIQYGKQINQRGQSDQTKEEKAKNYIYNHNMGYALNDIVITRKGFSRIISLDIYVNDVLVDNFRGDGVIVSTPTGSTAYNLSAGGPIVIPQASVVVITPICPHSLSPRSIVVPAEDTIKIVVGKSKKTQEAEAIATFDGNKVVDLGTDDIILVSKAQYNTKLIKLSRTGIYEILRSKLGHDGD